MIKFGPNLQLNIDLLLRVALTGTCFIQKIYAPSSSLSKEEEGAYILWMKQVPVVALCYTSVLIHFYDSVSYNRENVSVTFVVWFLVKFVDNCFNW